jgi:transcriptional regulator with XRE-family HTH domain
MIEVMARSYSSWAVPSLRPIRLQKLLTQRDLAGRAQVDLSTIVRLEQGGTAQARTVRKLARALRVSTEALMTQPEEESGTE